MSSLSVLVLDCLLVVAASLAGGWLPLLIRLTHQRMQLAVSFVAGAMLGVGLLHLLPHSVAQLGSIDKAVTGTLVGFLAMFFVERFFAFHHHDVPPESHDDCAHEHDPHDLSREPNAALSPGVITWWGAAVGLTLHSLADGVALAASINAEWTPASGMTAGLATFLVILLHKPFDALTIGTLMAAGSSPRRQRHVVNLIFALMIPLGAILFHAGLRGLEDGGSALLGQALAFSAGTFICIASSDLLPELQFHHHDRVKLSAALVLGLSLSWVIGYFEHSGHDRHVQPAGEHEHEHRH